MRYLSLDLETTGLDHTFCQMIEFGAVIDDLSDPKPLDQLPRFHRYILRDRYCGDPYALAMHAEIFRRISKHEKPWEYATPLATLAEFATFLSSHGLIADRPQTGGPQYVNVAGKNFSRFDINFLQDDWGQHNENLFSFHHRVLDPASMYFDPAHDRHLPSTAECMKRAGIGGQVAHTAVEDAIGVIKLIRHHYGLPM